MTAITQINPADWDRALDALATADRVMLACHIGPDGDALGSMLALGLALRARGCSVVASWGSEPFSVPDQYGYLPGQDLLGAPPTVDEAPETMITFDAGSLARLGSLGPHASAAQTLIVIDHHASNDRFGTVNLVDPTAAASAVIVFELLARLGARLTADIASCLYTGLVTDTGRFQYSNTTPAVHQIAADLIEAGAPHVAITDRIYNTNSVGYLRLAAIALERIIEREGMVWTFVTQDDLRSCGVEMEDIEGLIDLVRTADNADVAAVLKQQEDGRYRVSLRSRGASDVGTASTALGGGGHALAAGFTSVDGDPHAAIEQIASALRA